MAFSGGGGGGHADAGVACVLPARQTCEQMVFILEQLQVRSQAISSASVYIYTSIHHVRLMVVISFVHGDRMETDTV